MARKIRFEVKEIKNKSPLCVFPVKQSNLFDDVIFEIPLQNKVRKRNIIVKGVGGGTKI